MTKYSKGDYTNCRCNICEIVDEDDEIVCNVVTEDFEKVVAILEENERLKKELKIYHKVANCSNCAYHNYDWDVDDGYGGEEYEVCDKGNDMSDRICKDWEEL